MRVVFFFMTEGGADAKNIPSWNPRAEGHSKYLENGGLVSEGLYWMLKKMKKEGIIQDLLLVIESSRNTGSFVLQGNQGYVVPHISCIDPFLKKDDVLFVRGGFRGWHDWLKSKKGKHWLLLYAANTGRERWPWWDVVLDDIRPEARKDEAGRIWWPFNKPINGDFFFLIPDAKPSFDVCIGASYIHDKKGQWRAIRAINEYQKIYGRAPKCIMPGAVRSSTETVKALQIARRLGIKEPGMVPRSDLNMILNTSKIFIHLGTSGQNDRGPLEALKCGCQLIIGSPKYHSPVVTDRKVCEVPENKDDFVEVANLIYSYLKTYKAESRKVRSDWYVRTTEMPLMYDMNRLFYRLRNLPPSYTVWKTIWRKDGYEVTRGYL